MGIAFAFYTGYMSNLVYKCIAFHIQKAFPHTGTSFAHLPLLPAQAYYAFFLKIVIKHSVLTGLIVYIYEWLTKGLMNGQSIINE